MSSETTPEEKRKRRSTSIPFLIFVVIIGLVGYFKGEEIMTYALYLQEQWSHNSSVAEDRRRDKLAGPAKEGEYDWVAPIAAETEAASVRSPIDEERTEPPPMSASESSK